MAIPVFDGHNDVLLRLLLKKSSKAARQFVDGDGEGHIDLPRLKQGRMMGGMFAIFAPDPHEGLPDDDDLNPPYAGGVSQAHAANATDAMLAIRDEIIALAKGAIRHCVTAAEIRASLAEDSVALVTHIEGAEAISADLRELPDLYDRGLRSLGPVWSRPNVFGEGVPFRFPSSPDTGSGLTEAGRNLVRTCNAMGILVDLSHITEKGFWDVAKTSNAPLVATHSNAHAVAPSSRNLTDEQLKAIGATGGMVGLNYATGFLRADGGWTVNTPPKVMIDHLEHMLRLAGEDCVGLGSDFDGARIPAFIGDSAGTSNLLSEMEKAGFGTALIEKIAWRNWVRVLEKTWGA